MQAICHTQGVFVSVCGEDHSNLNVTALNQRLLITHVISYKQHRNDEISSFGLDQN